MKIGVFDSGVGGLSVLKSLIDARLFSEIIYYGDTARVPYGNKDKATIVRFSLEAVDFFIPHKIDMLIVACNTASAYALKDMQKIAPFPVIGVVESGVLSLSNKIKNKKDSILIIATKATIKSGIYEKELRKLGYENITSLQTGLFVPLVEEGVFEGELLEATFRHYFGGLNSFLGNSVLGMQFRTCENFRASTDSSLVDSPKIFTNTKATPQFLEFASGAKQPSLPLRFCESQNLGKNSDKNTESTLDSANQPQQTIEAIAVEVVGFLGDFGCETGLKSAKHSKSPKSPQDAPKSKLQTQDESGNTTPKAIILACTHFPLIASQIRAYFDNKPILIHSGEAIVEFLLKNYKLDSAKKRAPKVQFYASADRAALQKTAKLWLKSL